MSVASNAVRTSPLPRTWLRPSPGDPVKEVLARAAQDDTLFDITTSPAFWGGLVRSIELRIAATVGVDLASTLTEAQAASSVEGEMISAFSAVGRQTIDALLLKVDRALNQHQISGALNALQFAKQDGAANYVGIDLISAAGDVDWLTILHSGVDVVVARGDDPSLQKACEARSIMLVSPSGTSQGLLISGKST